MDSVRRKRILVVGGTGFIGANLVRILLESHPAEVIVVDNLLSSERNGLPVSPEVTFVEGSITDDRVLGALKENLDYIFHLATFHGNQNSIFDPIADHENNTLTTLKLYERIKDFRGLKKVVYASAGCTVAPKTYDEATATSEDCPVSLFLDSPYQISKIVGEFYSNYYLQHARLPVVKARFQNVYGPGEILGAGKWRGTAATVWRNVIPTFIYRSLKQMPLIVENEGKATRDFIYVEDIVRGLLLCALKGAPGEVYNLASGVETSIRDLSLLINRIAGNPTPIQLGPERDWDRSGRRFGSTVKTKNALGFEARVGLDDGLKWTIDWTRENLSHIEACVGKHAAHLK
jgi:UDP-glucose 4-epimerase